MAKKTINLLIVKEEETKLEKRGKTILPVTAIGSLIVFVVLYSLSLSLTGRSIHQYDLLRQETEMLSAKIKSVTKSEGVYTSSVKLVNSIDSLLANNKNLITSFISRIYDLQFNGLTISEVSLDNSGSTLFAVEAADIDVLDQFLTLLVSSSDEFPFTNIKAQGITRDKKGSYTMKITLNIVS